MLRRAIRSSCHLMALVVSVRRTHLDDGGCGALQIPIPTGRGWESAFASRHQVVGDQRCGSSSAIRLAGCVGSGSVLLSVAQLSMLLEGIDWRRPERTWQPRTAA